MSDPIHELAMKLHPSTWAPVARKILPNTLHPAPMECGLPTAEDLVDQKMARVEEARKRWGSRERSER